MIKLIATDLDGTLFYPKRRLSLISKKNVKFLRDFHGAGGDIVLVSGRSRRMGKMVNKKLGFETEMLGCCGTYVVENGQIAVSHPLDRQAIMELYMSARNDYGIIGWMLFDDTDYIKIAPTDMGNMLVLAATLANRFLGVYREKYITSETKFIQAVAHHPVYKLMPCFGLNMKKARERGIAAKMSIEQKFPGKFTIAVSPPMIEITTGGVTKASTLESYIEGKHLTKDEIAVAGDSFNDMSLFDSFPNSYAMLSGEESVRKKAKYVVKTVADMRDTVLGADGKLKD